MQQLKGVETPHPYIANENGTIENDNNN
jgi:hypothetical protein